ncbi:hypothetical protein IQ249_04265 [Lusitaniella coriacea LEGE 07157]|uniref:Uncharacterized protein n=1 Tax=Lusitaniella coriacea LEGE 07157 TaxID=945747 RepID=A0A8J7AYS8_9CYAN|nr:hypothetical protein [Lusitaniella coriacea]MBE9115109.1 hypothetical protein [Lusitaniella coriacea LEGE 07157]
MTTYVLPLWSCYPRAPGIRSPIYHYLNSLFQDRLRSLPQLLDSEIQFGAAQLNRIAQNVRPQLSRDRRLEKVTVELEERLDRFKRDYHSHFPTSQEVL